MKIPPFIKALARICEKQSHRLGISGIHCESDGTTAKLTATDGRILASVHYPDTTGKVVSALASGKQLASAPIAAYKSADYDGETLRAGQTSMAVEIIDGRFPRFEEVYTIHDAPEGYAAVTLDAPLLRKLCELADAINDSEQTKGITLYVKGAADCVFGAVVGQAGEVARLAIMPRADGDKPLLPAFPARPGASTEPSPPPTRRARTPKGPPPEVLDDDTIAAAVCREPDAIASDSHECGLAECDTL